MRKTASRPLPVYWLYVLTTLLLSIPLFLMPVTFAANTLKVRFLQLNDVYQLQAIDQGKQGKRGGLVRIATLRQQLSQEVSHTVFILAGDTLSPSITSNIFQGKQMVEAWNALKLNYAALGNHEFDFGPDVLRQRMADSRFTWLAANVLDAKTGKPFNHMPLFVIQNIQGIKIAFFGLLTPDTLNSSKPGPGVRFQDPILTAKQLIPQLKAKGVKVIVAITHLPLAEDKKLAHQVPDINLILGGHDHTLLQSLVGHTPIFKVASDAQNLGRIDLNLDPKTGKTESMDWEILPVTADIAEDPTLKALNDQYEQQLQGELGKVVGYTEAPLNALQRDNRSRETNTGDLITDALRAYTGADVALMNGGSIRSNTTYGPGPLTRKDILSILPFKNPIYKIELSGKTLQEVLEHSLSTIEDPEAGKFLQVSGLQITYQPTKPAGQRLVSVLVNGSPLVTTNHYTVAVNSYMLEGGDGYTMLKGAKAFTSPDTARLGSEILLDQLSQSNRINPITQNRIQVSP